MLRRTWLFGLLALTQILASGPAFAADRQFKHPKYDGNRLDWCYTYQQDCGKKAADAYCVYREYDAATTFTKAPAVGLTRTIGDHSLCADSQCDSFLQITCTKALAAPVKQYDQPEFKNIRLDWCYAWGAQCGKPAAEAFCKLNGHGGAKSYKKEAGVAQTRVISNSQVCDGKCDGFANIVCQ